MRLLVSVRNAVEAAAAVAGGAHIIDAKEPLNGALGQVAPGVLDSIAAAVGGRLPISVALGEIGRNDTALNDPAFKDTAFKDTARDDIARGAGAAARAGAAYVKIGLAGMRGQPQLAADVRVAAAAAGQAVLILVAYADHERAGAPSPEELIALAGLTNAAGVLIDTYDKHGPSLTRLMTAAALRTFVTRVHATGALVAMAGRLTIEDIDIVHEAGADIIGVRGAAAKADGAALSRQVVLVRFAPTSARQ
jgi:uncharacterized protein (UPF0264 family)